MATITFKPRGEKEYQKIYVILVNGRETIIRRYTGYDIKRNDWSFATGRPKPNDEELKNLDVKLNNLKAKLYNLVNDAISNSEKITGDWLQKQIDIQAGKFIPEVEEQQRIEQSRIINSIDQYIKKPVKDQLKRVNSTLGKYRTLKIKIHDFETYKKKQYFVKDVNIKFRDDFTEYLTTVQQLSENTTGRYLRALKTICLDAKVRGIETHPQLEVVTGISETAHKIFLSFDEIETISKKEFIRTALDNARDWLVIGCYIGQRVGDLLNLTSKNIVYKDGLHLIELKQQKTGKSVIIPIVEPVQNILNKRDGNFPEKISSVKFNEHIKDVAKESGINEIVEGAKMIEVQDGKNKIYRKIIGKYEKWELVTSHICRRSFATNYYGEMITSLIINITGHSTESQYLEYVGKPPIDHARQIAEYFNSIYQKQREKLKKESLILQNNAI
ncbi:MAG TPA: phage integrase SAM-like domain-containing protein [Bacteroidales bacterium]|nr:phage integrase SAM-like domain-containing protein [Bacteroidales bacterium]